jgi:glycosyltransferase involved in cell wall biosynthesis
MKKISVVTPCYNEEGNVEILCHQIREVLKGLPQYDYEHLLIDNCSTDSTVKILKEIAAKDPKVKVIVNARNFGHVRSPIHGLFQASGDVMIIMASDLQDPPNLIPEFIRKWEEGFKIVAGVKTQSEESSLFYRLRSFYYFLVRKLADVELIDNFTGFGLYDRQIVQFMKSLPDPYPYFRGMISEIGFEKAKIEYTQPLRQRGITKNNFYSLYDMAMLGFVNHSKVPLRLATFVGFTGAIFSLMVAIVYFVYKLLYWNEFALGAAPMVIGFFFFSAVQLVFIGIIGEYVGAIYTQVKGRPLVFEKERINF